MTVKTMINAPIIDRGADFNEARTHRQRLWRTWSTERPYLVFAGMNPSVADEVKNDPTVTRVEHRARILGYGGIVMLNIMDVIETDSKNLDKMTPDQRFSTIDNFATLGMYIKHAAKHECDIVCGWGKQGQRYGDTIWFSRVATEYGTSLFCLGKNKDGSPVHPLYRPYDQPLKWFAGKHSVEPLYFKWQFD